MYKFRGGWQFLNKVLLFRGFGGRKISSELCTKILILVIVHCLRGSLKELILATEKAYTHFLFSELTCPQLMLTLTPFNCVRVNSLLV